MREAWHQRHPDHQLQGCMFHYSQNLWKYVMRQGLSTLYGQDSVEGKGFRGEIQLLPAGWKTASMPAGWKTKSPHPPRLPLADLCTSNSSSTQDRGSPSARKR